MSVILFVAWQPSRVFRTSYEAAAMLSFLLTKGDIKVRNNSKYLVNYLLFKFSLRFFPITIYKPTFLSGALSVLANRHMLKLN